MSARDHNLEPPRPEPDPAPVNVAEPVVPPEFAHTDPEEVEKILAAQAEQLARPASNVDIKGMPHFLRNVNGEEVCGTDGQPWPCDAFQGLANRSALLDGLAPADQLLPTMREAAQAAGMDLDEFAARLRQTRGQ